MSKKKSDKPLLRIVESQAELPKTEIEGEDELAALIRSINEKGKSSKASQAPEPQPPKAA